MENTERFKQIIKFRKKPAKAGRVYCFYIPASYINNGLIDPKKHYDVFIAEVPEAEIKEEDKEDHENDA